ncbi:MAG: hypothetical protein FWG42_01095 [Clostridiales bacterium]|nr:hypothetical protein [Clostridiales bacterium]
MKVRSTGSGSGMFLTELLMAILIFAVASAICLRVFVAANHVSAESSRLNHAVASAQNCAECFKATGGSLPETAALLGGAFTGTRAIEVRFDSGWQLLPPGEPSFCYVAAIVRMPEKAGSIDAQVTVCDIAGTKIFTIPVSSFQDQEAEL